MAFIEDKGAILDASIEEVWQYLTSEGHGLAHRGNARNFAVKETIGDTQVVAAERKVHGEWSAFVTKSTDYPPLCIVNEEVEGDFAGSKYVIVYTPEGKVTRVDVYADVRSRVHAPEQAHRLFLELLQAAYEDDVAQMRADRARAAGPRSSA
jgi:hypothetical protein